MRLHSHEGSGGGHCGVSSVNRRRVVDPGASLDVK